MEIETQQNATCPNRACSWLAKMVNMVKDLWKDTKRLGQEDPRRIVHSFKVGLAIAAVSFVYYFNFFYEGFGVSAMWAVMTVVVVFEFSVGATLGKGINRAIATLLGGALGIAAHRLASVGGENTECIILGLSTFIVAAVVTYTRFFPKLKARYDYGLLIFILTFSLITVSGYRDDEVLDMAYKRLFTILIGGSVTFFISIFICPIWAGEDLHNHIATNIDKLGVFLECFGAGYFEMPNDKDQENKASLDEYKSILNSKGNEDSLVCFAKWEPRHGKFRYRHPWDQYLKIGSLTRECANRIDSLNAYLDSDTQTPMEVRRNIKGLCTEMSLECSYALRELAMVIKTMTCSLYADHHIVKAKSAAKKLESSFKTNLWPDTDLLDIIPVVTVASLLMEIVFCTERIADSVHELATLSKYKTAADSFSPKRKTLEQLMRTPSIEESHNFNIITE